MAIQLHQSAEVEQTELRTRDTTRDEFQQSIDKDVKTLHDAWVKAGKPAENAKNAPYHWYTVNPDDKKELKEVIRRAATLVKATPVFYNDVKTKDGLVQVKFHLKAAPVKAATTGNAS